MLFPVLLVFVRLLFSSYEEMMCQLVRDPCRVSADLRHQLDNCSPLRDVMENFNMTERGKHPAPAQKTGCFGVNGKD